MYNVYIIAFPQEYDDYEERLDEYLMNYEHNSESAIYSCVIEDVAMTNVAEELQNYIENGFKEEENV